MQDTGVDGLFGLAQLCGERIEVRGVILPFRSNADN